MRRLFIVGAARSGTTWTRAMLAEHDAVVTGPESHLFRVLYGPLAHADGPRLDDALAAYDDVATGESPLGFTAARHVIGRVLARLGYDPAGVGA